MSEPRAWRELENACPDTDADRIVRRLVALGCWAYDYQASTFECRYCAGHAEEKWPPTDPPTITSEHHDDDCPYALMVAYVMRDEDR